MKPVDEVDEEFFFKPGNENAAGGGGVSKYVFEDGLYNGRVTGYQKGVAKSSGKPMITLEILGIEGPAEGIEYKQFLPLEIEWKLEQALVATGVKPDPEKGYRFADVVGKQVGMQLYKRTNPESGKTFMDIKKLVPPKAVGSGTLNLT